MKLPESSGVKKLIIESHQLHHVKVLKNFTKAGLHIFDSPRSILTNHSNHGIVEGICKYTVPSRPSVRSHRWTTRTGTIDFLSKTSF